MSKSVSAAQHNARIHNYSKMIVCSIKSNLNRQKGCDVKMTEDQKKSVDIILSLTEDLLKGWE